MAVNSPEGIGKEGEEVRQPSMSKRALIVWNLMMFTIGLGVGKDKGEGQQGRYHGESLL